MNAYIHGVALWLADFHLLATALLLGVLAALALVRQPAQRMAITKAALGALAVLAILTALPGWWVLHLITDSGWPPAPLVVDSSSIVQAERSVTQLIPYVNVDRIPRETSELPAIGTPVATASPKEQPAIDWWTLATIAHATGSTAVVLWLVGGAILARCICRGAADASPELRQLLQRVVGDSSAPRLLVSEKVATPVAVGMLRPTIILPTSIIHPAPSPLRGGLGRGLEACTSFTTPPHQGEGNGRELLPILAHEWAHLQNGDLKTLAASRLLLILLWPQPLYWVLRRGLRLDQEALADAAAAEVAGRVEYAERLVAWARGTPGAYAPRLAGAVGLWEGPSQLRRRIALLLNEKFAVMRTCSRRWREACFAALALAAVGLSLVTLQPAIRAADETAATPDEKVDVAEKPDTQHTIQSGPGTLSAFRVGPPATESPHEKNALVVKAVDGAGKPLAGLEATLYRVSYLEGTHERLKSAATNETGEVEFADLIPADEITAFAAIERAKEMPPNSAGSLLVSLKAPGLATMTIAKSRYEVGLHGGRQEVIMRPAAQLRGRVIDEHGAPIVGAVVTAGPWGGVLSIEGVNAVRSDENGEFVFSDLVEFDPKAAMERQRLETTAALQANKEKAEVTVFAVDAGAQLGVSQLVVKHPDFAVATIRGGNVPGNTEVTLAPSAAITGRVVDFKTGRPASGVGVVASGLLPAPPASESSSDAPAPMLFAIPTHTAKTRTDSEGRYRLDNLPAASYDVWAQPVTQDWKDAEWVSQAVGPVEAKAGAAVDAPVIAIGRGGVIRGQIIDGATGEPLKPSDDRATVRTVQEPVEGAPRQYGLNQNVPVDADGRFAVRVFPGKSRLHVNVSLDGKSQPYSKIDFISQGPGTAAAAVLEVQHGDELDQRFVVHSMEVISQRQAVQSKAYKLLQDGKHEEAMAAFDAIVADQPEDGSVRYGRSIALERMGCLKEAIVDLEHLLAGSSNDPVSLNNLASILATAPDDELRDGPRAVELASRAVEEMKKQPYRAREVYNTLDTLASAYAAAGDFEKAVATQREAIDAAPDEEKKRQLELRLKLYEAGKLYRRPTKNEATSSNSTDQPSVNQGAASTPTDSGGAWTLVRSAANAKDAGRATLGTEHVAVDFGNALDRGAFNPDAPAEIAEQDPNLVWKATTLPNGPQFKAEPPDDTARLTFSAAAPLDDSAAGVTFQEPPRYDAPIRTGPDVLTITGVVEPVEPAAASDRQEPNAAPSEGKAAPDQIDGRVVDVAGRPVEGAVVDVWTWFPGHETKTDGDGRFRVKSGQKRELAQFRVTKEGYSPHYVNAHQQGTDDLLIVLSNKTFLEGTLRGPDGQVVAGATIKAEHAARNEQGNQIGEVPTETTTDNRGKFKMYVFPETYEILVAVPEVGAVRVPGVVVQRDEAKRVDLQLEPAVRFQANVVDAATKEPFPGLVLWNWKDRRVIGVSDERGRIVIDGMMPGVYEFNVGHGEPEKIHGMTVYTHGALGRWWSADAETEWARKKIESDGWQRNFDDLSFDLSVGMQPVTIEVERGVTFVGRVVDPDGKPVGDATVAPAKTGSGNSLTGDTRYSVRTKADGTFRAVMPAGNKFSYNLIAHDGDYEEWRQWANGITEVFSTKPGDVAENIELRLTKPATVRGRLIAPKGQAVAGKQVRAQAADLKENRYYDPTTEVRTEDDGAFELKFIRPGRHVIQAEPFWIEAASAPEGTTVTVDVKEGEVHEGVELHLAPPPGQRTIFDAPKSK